MSYEYIPSPNKSSRNGNAVGGIIAHFTAGGDMDGTVKYLCNKIIAPDSVTKGVIVIDGKKYYDAKASCTYMTDRDGRTVMLVPENEAAWHAGSSTTKPQLNGKTSLNLWTIGHEICNWGALRKVDDKFYCWPNNWTHEYSGPTPVFKPKNYPLTLTGADYKLKNGNLAFPDGTIEYWEPYPDAQVEAIITLWKDITNRYQIGRNWIAGHEDVDPTRKIDPGPAMPWDYILDKVYATDMPSIDLSAGSALSETIISPGTTSRKESCILDPLCNLFRK